MNELGGVVFDAELDVDDADDAVNAVQSLLKTSVTIHYTDEI